MLAGFQPSLCSSINQSLSSAFDWAEHFGFSYVIMSVKCRMLWAGAKQSDQRLQ